MAVEDNEELSLSEIAEACKQREAMYSLIASLFIEEPSKDLLKELRTKRYPAKTGNDNIDKGNKLLATYLTNIWENSELELAVDYVRTFVGYGVSGSSAAYPYESTYTSEKHLLMQGARDEVRSIYKSVGLDKLQERTDEDDHVAFELTFMSIMCKRCAEAAEAENAALVEKLLTVQYNFIKDHLGYWTPVFVETMRRYAKTDFFLAASYLLEGFMEVEAELFNIEFPDFEED